MSRQPKSRTAQPRNKEDEQVEVLSNNQVEPIPEEAGAVTQAAAKAAPRDPEFRGPAKALQNGESSVKPTREKEFYRVLNDKRIMGATGFRARLRAGKEIDNVQYDIKALKRQGVQLERISEEELEA